MNILHIIQNFVKKSKSLDISKDMIPEKSPHHFSINPSRRRFFQQVGVFLTASLMPQWLLYAKGQGGRIIDVFGYPVGESYQYVRPGRSSVGKLVNFRGAKGGLKLRKAAFQAYLSLKRQAAKQGISLVPISGYRSLATQKSLYRQYGASRAEKPGYSEHNIGTTIDFAQVQFPSKAFLWLLKEGIKAGWVPTYYYRRTRRFMREPWHWRYVGKTAAKRFYLAWRPQIERDKRYLEGLQKKGTGK